MVRPILLMLLALTFLTYSPQALASSTTAIVGTCRPTLQQYKTIQSAVNGVASGTTILVCPGTYPEQVIIDQSVNLQGISSGDSAQVVITIPGSSLTAYSGNLLGFAVAPQVAVRAGPVNISNITVDGTGSDCGSATLPTGIHYQTASSGTVNEVSIHSQCWSGMVVENETNTVTIQNSSVFDVFLGIAAGSPYSPPPLVATIKGNNIVTHNGNVALYLLGGGVNASGNFLTGDQYGVITYDASNTISGNTIANSPVGVEDFAGNITSNKIWNSSNIGIVLTNGNFMNIQSNIIDNSPTGIEFNCSPDVVSHNVIRNAQTAMKDVPGTFSGSNSFVNVATIRDQGTCP